MKPQLDWHNTPTGRLVIFLGSVRFAVPVMFFTAIALIYGTWLESTSNALVAKQLVYGSWWFVALMALICITLILSVVARFPLRKKHTGFVIVHASLIVIIVSGFTTFYTKAEGTMALKEGSSASTLQTTHNELQILKHDAGKFDLIDAQIVQAQSTVTVNDIQIEILEVWQNTKQESTVLNDGKNKLHAVELQLGHDDEGHWIGQLASGQTPPVLHDIQINVLPEGESWAPPSQEEQSHPLLHDAKGDIKIENFEPGTAVADGWSIESVQWFKHAIIDAEGIQEGQPSRDNPAIQLILAHTDGSRERHTAFDNFRGSINKKQLDGELFSPVVLEYLGDVLTQPILTMTRDETATTAHFNTPAGFELTQRLDGQGPWELDLQGFTCTILHAYANARGTVKLVQAQEAEENLPAIRVAIPTISEPMTLIWGQRSVIQIQDEIFGIAYTPSTIPVPFTIELIDFRKKDYPGSSMAMAYESDVIFTDGLGNSHEQTIWMNNPLEHNGWKVYQSGFVGSDLSIFQITKDPGLIPMYAGCIGLCLGFLVVYYSRAYTQGHPGMPKVFESRNTRSTTHASAKTISIDSIPPRDSDDLPAGISNQPDRSGLESEICVNPNPGSRTHNADGHLRKKNRGRSHRSHKVE